MKKIIVKNPSNLETMKWSDLKRDYTPNALKDKKKRDVSDLKKSILTIGFAVPLFIWEEGKYITDGAGRFMTLELLEYEGHEIPDIPFVKVEAASLEEAKRITMVISSQYGEVTEGSLTDFTIDMDDIDLSFTNVNGIGIEDIKWTPEENTEYDVEEDEVPEVPKVPKSKLGDVYKLGRHRVICGDALDNIALKN